MNAHIPQSYEATAELAEIAAVPMQIIRPRDSTPVIAVVQDALAGAYLATRPNNLFTRREFMNMMMKNKRFKEVPEARAQDPETGAPRYNGQQIVGTLFAPINLTLENSMYDSDKSDYNLIKIQEGDFMQGVLDKGIFNKAGKGILHTTYNDYGPKAAVDLLDGIQNMMETYLIMKGFSVGISDLIADDETRRQMEEAIAAKKKEIDDLILQIHTDLFTNNSGKSNQEEFEARAIGILNRATGDAGKIGVESLSAENRLMAMVRSGSKGDKTNVAQMIACVGQQAPEGKRIPYGFTDRTLPHYKMYDDGAEARGFVEGSFLRGLTPQEFFFHAMSGREGLIDTAVKTAETGYTQRQLIKAMEDLMTHHDGTVRDVMGKIVQFRYGEDGANSTKLEGISLPLVKLTDKQIKSDFGLEGVDFAPILSPGVDRGDDAELLAEFVEKIFEDRKMLVEGVFGNGRSIGLATPLNLERILLNIKVKFKLDTSKSTDLTPLEVLEGINKIIERTQPFNKIWTASLRFHLAPHKIVVKERFTKDAWNALVEIIVVKNWKAWAVPGELVGIIAAQSIGEPTTQMSSLKTTKILVNLGKDKFYKGEVGKFVDELLEKHKSKVVTIGQDSVVLDLEEDVEILGVSTDEKTSWRRISQISRHPANGGMVEVHTRSGRKTTATLSHSFLKRSTAGIVPVLGSDLKVGMRIPVARKIPVVNSPTFVVKKGETSFALDREFGWLCGIYLADGSFSGHTTKITKIAPIVEEKLSALCKTYGWTMSVRHYRGEYGPSKENCIASKDLRDFLMETFGEGSYTKSVGGLAFNAPLEFIQGLIGGYFDGDGNVSSERQMIRAGSRSQELIRDINNLLGYCDMFGTLCKEKSASIPGKTMYTLNIPRKFARLYKETIGFELPEKASELNKIIEYNEREDPHSQPESIDKIPELGGIIAQTGKLLRMPGQSRTYGRWVKKESIGRRTLKEYIEEFKEMLNIYVEPAAEQQVRTNIALLESALNGDVLWDEIVDLVYLDDPKEYVYDFTVPGNDSFMVDDNILVHNTLNSVDWDTEIIISKNGRIMTPQIGEFIDDYYNNCKDDTKIQRLPNNQIYIPLDDGNDWKAMSCDEDGNMRWTKLEAITRHPVVNDDGSDTILKVTLESGRVVKATKAKSFLTLQDGKILGTNGSDLKVGDELPIGNSLALHELNHLKEINLREILPPTEYIYGTEVKKAFDIMSTSEDRHWFQKNQGKLFTIPYSRSDSFRDAFEHGKNSNDIRPGNVYNKRMKLDVCQIPETIPLTEDFGFFAGAYLAEGMSNKNQIHITNNDSIYLSKIKALMESWNVGTHGVCQERECKKTGIKGTTTSLIIHSTILAKIMKTWFGRVSYEKTLPDWVFQAPDEFIRGLVDGYISGDGTICKIGGSISASSVSEKLLIRMGVVFARYGIYTTNSSCMPDKRNFNSVSRHYILNIPVKYSNIFHNNFKLTIEHKQSRLDVKFGKRKEDTITCKWKETKNVVWDKIKSIEEIRPMGDGWVYDITVEATRNFVCSNMLSLKDTFHQAGVAAKSAVTRGVPRLKELLKVTKKPKASSLTITLKPAFRNNKDIVRQVSQDLELTLLKDIVTKAAIYYDPDDENTILPEDRDVIKFFKALEIEKTQGESATNEIYSKWILRFEFDREKMFNKNINMDDVYFVIQNAYGYYGETDDSLHTIYSDYNSQKLVMRIRPKQGGFMYGDDLAGIKKFLNILLQNTIIRGISGIRAVTWRKDANRIELQDGEYKKVDQYLLDTDGSNFVAVMTHPCVDGNKLYSTNIYDIFDQLGIEATRSVLYSEINGLFDDADINYRHLGLLCDSMAHTGRPMSVSRYGINKMDNGPLAKACFEETEKVLNNAAVFGEMDPVTGVSANIMMGQPIRAGTAFTQILLDESALPRLLQDLPPIEEAEEEEEVDAPTQNMINQELYGEETDACARLETQMNMVLPTTTTILEEDEDIELVEIEK